MLELRASSGDLLEGCFAGSTGHSEALGSHLGMRRGAQRAENESPLGVWQTSLLRGSFDSRTRELREAKEAVTTYG